MINSVLWNSYGSNFRLICVHSGALLTYIAFLTIHTALFYPSLELILVE